MTRAYYLSKMFIKVCTMYVKSDANYFIWRPVYTPDSLEYTIYNLKYAIYYLTYTLYEIHIFPPEIYSKPVNCSPCI